MENQTENQKKVENASVVIFNAIELAQKRGTYTLEESAAIFQAMTTLRTETEKKQAEKSERPESTIKERFIDKRNELPNTTDRKTQYPIYTNEPSLDTKKES